MKVCMVVSIISLLKSIFIRKRKKENKRRFIPDEVFNDIKKKSEDKLNSILDKISKRGYKSLSSEEKKFLEDYSKK